MLGFLDEAFPVHFLSGASVTPTPSDVKVDTIKGQPTYTSRLRQIHALLSQQDPPSSAHDVQKLLGHGVLASRFTQGAIKTAKDGDRYMYMYDTGAVLLKLDHVGYACVCCIANCLCAHTPVCLQQLNTHLVYHGKCSSAYRSHAITLLPIVSYRHLINGLTLCM